MLIVWIVATLWVIPAVAVQIESNSFAAGATLVDFEGDDSALPTVPGIQFIRAGSSGAAEGWFAGGASSHGGELFGERALSGLAFRGNFSSVGVVFTNAVEAAGAWVSGLASSRFGQANVLTISAFDAAGTLVDQAEVELGLESMFVGFHALEGIARLEWSGDNEGYFGVDNLTAGQLAPMPEPGTAALVGLGLLGLAAVRRER
jgi:hypothetical protein